MEKKLNMELNFVASDTFEMCDIETHMIGFQ